jgi:hypothetical protein
MAMISVRCPVLGAHVVCVTDLEGSLTRIICAEYDEATGSCRLKKSALGDDPLAQLLGRASENAFNTRSTLCGLRAM